MFILVTPMSRSGAERPRPGVTGHSQSRSDSSSRSSRPKVASLSIRRCRWHVCSIFSLLMSFRRRMSCLASCWSCKRMSVCERKRRETFNLRFERVTWTKACGRPRCCQVTRRSSWILDAFTISVWTRGNVLKHCKYESKTDENCVIIKD